MNTLYIIIAVAAAGWFLLIFGLKGMAILLRKSAVKATMKALDGENILKMSDNVSFLGADFPGPNLPPRTSGVLAVTDTRLLFLPWFPRRAITLPKDSIAKVSLQDIYGEMAYNIPVLLLKIKGVGDSQGSMAWLAHEAQEWEREIRKVIGNR
jgi:hypothetical protein